MVDTAKLDVTRLFDFGVPDGQYVIRATSKTLSTTHKCNFDLATVVVGKDGPSQVFSLIITTDRIGANS